MWLSGKEMGEAWAAWTGPGGEEWKRQGESGTREMSGERHAGGEVRAPAPLERQGVRCERMWEVCFSMEEGDNLA